jgi:methylthioribose-1-phosphate isomerase
VTEDEAGTDLARRGFFKAFGREALQTAAQLAGAASALRRGTTAATTELLGLGLGDPAASAARYEDARLAAAGLLGTAPGEVAGGARSPFRLEDDVLIVLDQRRLPAAISELRASTAPEVADLIRRRVVNGGPLLAQLAAYGLAASADRQRTTKPYSRSALLRGAANALRSARPSAPALGWALDRSIARWGSVGDLADGDVIADALRAEADALASSLTMDHARLGRLAAEALPRPEDRALELVVLGPAGSLMNGMVGSGLGIVQALVAAGRAVHVWVPAGGPALIGARLTAWELRTAGVPHTVLPDSAIGHLFAEERVDAVLVAPESVAANGDTRAGAGSYAAALLGARHDVPLYVSGHTANVDLQAASGQALRGDANSAEELEVIGVSLGDGYPAALDLVPAELITALATEEGVIPAEEEAIRAAIESSAGRRVPLPAPARPDDVPQPVEAS